MPAPGQTTVIFNDKFFDEILHSTGVRRMAGDVAYRAQDIARQTAPVDTGDYRDSIKVRSVVTAHRVVYRVVAYDAKSLLIESKTGNLARALKAARKAG